MSIGHDTRTRARGLSTPAAHNDQQGAEITGEIRNNHGLLSQPRGSQVDQAVEAPIFDMMATVPGRRADRFRGGRIARAPKQSIPHNLDASKTHGRTSVVEFAWNCHGRFDAAWLYKGLLQVQRVKKCFWVDLNSPEYTLF